MAEIRDDLPPGTPIEVWWQDEARIGQKNKITRRWAKRGTRPSAPHDQRTQSAYIFGAICPARGVGAALVLPKCNTAAMTLHLMEISATVAPGAHAVVIVDQAGWHFSNALEIPDNITLLPLPPKSPELNPVENIWQLQRHPRSLLLRLEPAHRPAIEDHVHRTTQLGASMILFAGWY